MSGEAVLIAAFSGRALAQSARRAGYEPLVVDAFGDLDTRAAAAAYRVLDGAMQTGFRTKPLFAALDELSASAATPPIGLVLGSGFEDKPRLVAALASRYRLLGADAATYRACKDPTTFFALLDKLGIPHPETQIEPPKNPEGWISKRIGGSGGRHIRVCCGEPHAKPRRYFQKRLEGERFSLGVLFSTKGGSVYPRRTRQWISPSDRQPFRYGGCVSIPRGAPFPGLMEATFKLMEGIRFSGMASLDFIVADTVPYLLEVNPRPGASLDVLDNDEGYLFAGHLTALDSDIPRPPPLPSDARAAAILHADRGPITLGDIPWPEWSADRGAPGTFVPLGAPLATVLAEAPTSDAAEALARARLAELEDLIYGHARA